MSGSEGGRSPPPRSPSPLEEDDDDQKGKLSPYADRSDFSTTPQSEFGDSIQRGDKDEHYWERRKRNNDASKKSRSKRRLNEATMEKRLQELTKENSLLKSKLEAQKPSVIVSATASTSPPTVIRPTPDSAVFGFEGDNQSAASDSAAPIQSSFGSAFTAPSQIPSQPLFDFSSLLYPNGFGSSPNLMAAALAAASQTDGLSSIASILQHNPNTFATFPGANFGADSLLPSLLPYRHSMGTFGPLFNGSQPLRPSSNHIVDVVSTSPPVSTQRHSSITPNSPPIPSLTRGPGNVHFVGYLPTAQEPKSSAVMHSETSRVPTAQWDSPKPKRSAFNSPPSNPQNNGTSFLGSLLATTTLRRSPSVPESRTEKQSGLVERRPENPPQYKYMSSLAVNLSAQSATSSVAATNGTSSGKSDNDSMGSPHSTHSTTDSTRSQNSPPPTTSGSAGGTADSHEGEPIPTDRLDHERYMDRRRRNNEAAKRCRANRRAVFEYRSRRAQQLEAENGDLRQEVVKLNTELEQLKAIIASNHRLLSA